MPGGRGLGISQNGVISRVAIGFGLRHDTCQSSFNWLQKESPRMWRLGLSNHTTPE